MTRQWKTIQRVAFVAILLAALGPALSFVHEERRCPQGAPLGWPCEWRPNPCAGVFRPLGFMADVAGPLAIAWGIAYGIPWVTRRIRKTLKGSHNQAVHGIGAAAPQHDG
jgi:hypothetical protein